MGAVGTGTSIAIKIMANTKIEWTQKSWNPLSGCSRKSAGCERCYAETLTKRLEAMGQEKYTGLLNEHGRFNGVIKFDEKALLIPLKTTKPTKWFVNSMSDLFHENVKDKWIDKVFEVMYRATWHTFQILTKRPERMLDYISKSAYLSNSPLENVWFGVSVETPKQADERIPLLLDTPAAVRWLSCEPLLEKVDLTFVENDGYKLNCLTGRQTDMGRPCEDAPAKIDWVVVGGESGYNARPCSIEWIRLIVEQCKFANVPVFVKQLGRHPRMLMKSVETIANSMQFTVSDLKGGKIEDFPCDLQIREFPNTQSADY